MNGIQGAARRLEARGETGPPIETQDRASSPEIIVTSPDAAALCMARRTTHERYLGRHRSFLSDELMVVIKVRFFLTHRDTSVRELEYAARRLVVVKDEALKDTVALTGYCHASPSHDGAARTRGTTSAFQGWLLFAVCGIVARLASTKAVSCVASRVV